MSLKKKSTVRYRLVEGWPAYRVGTDGSFWSRWNPGGRTFRAIWRRRWPYDNGRGYMMVHLKKGGSRKAVTLHSLVLRTFVGERPKGMWACHYPDPNKKNCALSNLRWDTPKANGRDSILQGLSQQGERHGAALLTDKIVRFLRKRAKIEPRYGFCVKYGKRFDVHVMTISSVVIGRTWKHVV